jgi:Lar family restriction alleviation protein
MKAKLKKCPFCGGEARLVVFRPVGSRVQYSIRCTNPTCFVATYSEHLKSRAVSAWNKRVK